jgi:hypothetical protein
MPEMPKVIPVLEIDSPHFTVRLYENLLRIDLKGSFKNEIEEALENKPILKKTLGGILGIFVPLHVHLSDIDGVHMDETGKVKLTLPHHRNVVIPLEPKDAQILVEKLNTMIPAAKRRNWERIIKNRTRELRRKSKKRAPSAYVTMPWYYPTEQIDIIPKLNKKKKKRKK